MTIDLSDLPNRNLTIKPLDFGGLMDSSLGGASLYLDRLGARYTADIVSGTMFWEPHGRQWASLLLRGRREGAIIPIDQPGLAIGAPGAPVVSAATGSGRDIPISGLTAGYTIRCGQWLNYIIGGRRYLDQATADVTASGGGAATVNIQNLLRVPLTAGATIDLTTPCIQGFVAGDFPLDYPLDRTVSFSFSISETR